MLSTSNKNHALQAGRRFRRHFCCLLGSHQMSAFPCATGLRMRPFRRSHFPRTLRQNGPTTLSITLLMASAIPHLRNCIPYVRPPTYTIDRIFYNTRQNHCSNTNRECPDSNSTLSTNYCRAFFQSTDSRPRRVHLPKGQKQRV